MSIMKTKELIAEISDLPIDERVKAVDQILKTFNRPDQEVEEVWAKEALRRLDRYKEGKVQAIPGKQFDKEVQEMKKQFAG